MTSSLRLSRQCALPTIAVALVAAEWISSAAFGAQRALVLLVLVVAPGLAALPFLPDELRRLPVSVPIIPIAGVAVSSIALISLSSTGASLTATHIRTGMLALALVALLGSTVMPPAQPSDGHKPALSSSATLLLLGAAVALGISLQAIVLGGKPLPGDDWGSYLMYAEQVSRRHALLIDNPYWMLGGHPFPLDAGAPSLYGAYLVLTAQAASTLAQGIWLFAVLVVLAIFVFVAVAWGRIAGVVAAGVYAATPMNLDILSWHGLANVDALTVLPVALLPAAFALRGEANRRWAAVLAASLAALAAAHRFSFVLGLAALAPPLLYALVRRFGPTARFLAWTACFSVCLGAGVAIDFARRNASLHGVQSYRAYLPTKLRWDLVGRDLTWPLLATGVAALVVVLLVSRRRRDDGPVVLLGLLLAILGLTYAWLAHVPAGYNRAAYFLPLLVAALVGITTSWLLPRVALPIVALLVVATAVQARPLARDFRDFYGHTNAASLAGLGYVNTAAKPRDVIVTDQCWSFLATWLLHRPVLAALDPALILPATEVTPDAVARRILYGDPEQGARLALRRHIRFALVDPQCANQTGAFYPMPTIGRLVYASTRLLVFDLRPTSG